jgi:5-methylcytosine-specific restriction protein A
MMPAGPAYCTDCAPQAKAELEAIREENLKRKMQKYNRQRDPKYLTFYRSKDWRITSRAKLQDVGYKCEARLAGCQGLAVEVHHTKPIQTPEGWDLRLEWSNLEAVCTSCHNGRHPEKLRKMSEDGVIDMRTVKRF